MKTGGGVYKYNMKFAEKLIKKRKIVLISAAVVVLLSIAGIFMFLSGGKINSDMLVYLPESTSTYEGIEFLKQNFNIVGDAFVVAEGTDADFGLEAEVERIREIKGITQLLWYGDVINMESYASNPMLSKIMNTDTALLKDYMKRAVTPGDPDTKYNYVILILMEYSPSTEEAFNVHKQIRKELDGRSVAISGMTALADRIMSETLREAAYYIIFAALAVGIVLLIATSSFFEPVILLTALGVSVIVNMGTNLIYPSVSIISFAACSVLQLGIAMDYAIFYMHAYKEKRASADPQTAAAGAFSRTFTSIMASGLTSIGGFAALAFMEFRIGADLAAVIIKGILLSMLTVIILQPCLAVACDKLLIKTAHREIKISYNRVADAVVRRRKWIAAAAFLLIVPAFFAQHSVKYSYLKIYGEPEECSPQEQLAAKLGNQIIAAVPLELKTGTHKDFIRELLADEKISGVTGAYSALDISENNLEGFLDLLYPIETPKELSALDLLFRKVDGKWYTLYLITIDGDTEDEAAFATHAYMTATVDKYFEESYPLGVLTAVYDMSIVTVRDFVRVTLFSAAVIFIIMCFLLKSPGKSFAMVLLIELAVWINIGLNFLFGLKMNFMVYIIISSVQLGCTVDYGILLATRFEEEKRKLQSGARGAAAAAKATFPSITLSASMIFVVCTTITFVSKNLLVSEMAWVLARGALISYLCVIFILPALLAFFTKIKMPKKRADLP